MAEEVAPAGAAAAPAEGRLLKKVAGVAGLEPATPGFGDRCSSQLSYTPTSWSLLFMYARRYNTKEP